MRICEGLSKKDCSTHLVDLVVLPQGVLRAVVERHCGIQLVVEHSQSRARAADQRIERTNRKRIGKE